MAMGDFQAVDSWPLAGVLGLFIGSYLNVIAWRWFRGDIESPNKLNSRSKCASCGKVLGWKELIPLVSYFIQRGRCVACRAPLSLRYPVAEIITAIVFASIVVVYGVNPASVLLIVLASILLAVALIDAETQLIPDLLSVLGLGVTAIGLIVLRIPNLIGRLVAHGSFISERGIVGAIIAIVILGSIVVATRGRGMGIGDIKLGGILGLSLGGPATLLALFCGFVSGALVGLILIQQKQASLKTAVPFGPFLVFGWFVAVIFSRPIIAWYTGL